MKQVGTISANDTNLYLVTDSVEEAVEYIKENTIKKFDLKHEQPYKPFKWLFE